MPETARRRGTRLHPDGRRRCGWCPDDPLYVAYHDREWGVPLHDDRKLFELLCLEGAQAGLSWITVLRKRPAYRRAFLGFEPSRVARITAAGQARLMRDPGIIRNRLKIAAFVANARAFLEVVEREGSFARFLWQFVGGRTLDRRPRYLGDIPPFSPESDAMSRELKRRGFRFVGSTICYAFMQGVGMVNDHQRDCWVRTARGRRARATRRAKTRS
jgi:DNA-3-methyladenine glycosylase I